MTKSPNILFISIDDLNDWVGVLGGYPGVKTPNIDRLAQRGTLFSNAHTPVPVCNGARTAVLTGLQPSTTGIYSNFQDWRLSLSHVVTLPEHFRNNGYETAAGGKIFHYQFDKREAFDLYCHHGASPSAPKVPGPIQFGPLQGTISEMSDFKVAKFAKNYLEEEHSKPFFLAVGFVKPHTDLVVPKEFFDLYPLDSVKIPQIRIDDLEDVPGVGTALAGGNDYQQILKLGQWQKIVQAYLATISFVDSMIGRVLDSLYSSDYANNTIVVLWSDNGWHLGEKLHWKKETLWEEATRVPLIISAPGIADRGEVSSQAVSLVDLYPTLVELTGLPTKNVLEGESLVPLLTNPNFIRETPAISFWAHSFSVRNERWRYIQYFDGSEELYDHNNDPNEWTNLAGKPEYQGIKQELAAWIPSRENLQLGTEWDDTLRGSENNDVLVGRAGNDRLMGREGDDHLISMVGKDTLRGGEGDDFLLDQGDSDLLRGDEGNDILAGGTGDDILKGGKGRDVLFGGKDNDILKGGSGKDTIDNTFKSDGGDDLLKGQGGNDLLVDNLGNDTLEGGKGRDILCGGAGSDVFLLKTRDRGVDTIIRFEASDQIIIISESGEVKKSTVAEEITPEHFVLGAIAKEPDDIVLYNPQTGSLFFDPDGSGPLAKIRIAMLECPHELNSDNIALFF